MRRYLLVIVVGNILWEFVQLPGFTPWSQVGWNWFIFLPVLGAAGDILIAATSLVLALILIGDDDWPRRRALYWRVAALATLQGIAYTAYSEWRHAVVLHHWTYSALMPIIPRLDEALDLQLAEGSVDRSGIEVATIEGAVHRLRPKLMTVFVVILSLAPVFFESGIGNDVMEPIAVPIAGGMVTSSIAVLILLPVLFAILKERALCNGTLRPSGAGGSPGDAD